MSLMKDLEIKLLKYKFISNVFIFVFIEIIYRYVVVFVDY